MAAKGFLLLPLFLISVIRYYRSKQAYNKAVSPIHVRYLYGICPVLKRTSTGQVTNI